MGERDEGGEEEKPHNVGMRIRKKKKGGERDHDMGRGLRLQTRLRVE